MHPDDPRLTAYACGELSADEARAVAAALAADPALAQVVDDARATAAALEAAFLREPQGGLDARRRSAIELHLRAQVDARQARDAAPAPWDRAPLARPAAPAPAAKPASALTSDGDVDVAAPKAPPAQGAATSTSPSRGAATSTSPSRGAATSTSPSRGAATSTSPSRSSPSRWPWYTASSLLAAGLAVAIALPTVAGRRPRQVETIAHDAPPAAVAASSPQAVTTSRSAGSVEVPVATPALGPEPGDFLTVTTSEFAREDATGQPVPRGGEEAHADVESGGLHGYRRPRSAGMFGSRAGSQGQTRALGRFGGAQVGAGGTGNETNAPAAARTIADPADPLASAPAKRSVTPHPDDHRRYPTASRPPAGDTYEARPDQPFRGTLSLPLSTLATDVDTASYSNVRRFLDAGALPPAAAVRIEELLNAFAWRAPQPAAGDALAAAVEISACPWQRNHRLARIVVAAPVVDRRERPAANLVFLVDVSGSMEPADRLPLVRDGLARLVDALGDRDRIAIVTYAGEAGVALDSTPGTRKDAIHAALTRLRAGGSTNGGDGLRRAYALAREHFIAGGTNRVLLATDGDFNVGVTSREQLVDLVRAEKQGGIHLTVLGVGRGNLQDATLEALANRGDGNYAYLDSAAEARRVLVDQLAATLVTVAKDAKVQVEFNPAQVAAWRLIGHENRVLAARDFNDDRVDAGEIGAGHRVTALYELVPAGGDVAVPAEVAAETLTVKLRWQPPQGGSSRLLLLPAVDDRRVARLESDDQRFAAAVAGFGLLLRGSPARGACDWSLVRSLAAGALGEDRTGERRAFIGLVDRASALSGEQAPEVDGLRYQPGR